MNLMILANGCNITKSEKFKGSEYFPYPLYLHLTSEEERHMFS